MRLGATQIISHDRYIDAKKWEEQILHTDLALKQIIL